jgi:WD40 repeat protein/tRNA A-37 threonylcarbamoyl transferase component Bud32
VIDTDETPAMTPSYSTDSLRKGLLEEVLEEYMRRIDRGEVVDRDQFLARHPEVAAELRSYFAGTDEVERLRQLPECGTPASLPSGGLPQTCGLEEFRPGSGEGRRVGDYELLEQIGYGGMGIIYKARQVRLQRLVALKMIRPDRLASPADVLRFRSEAEAAASLDHPNIAPIYEVGEHGGEHYFSMKLIEGGSLAQHLPRLAGDLPAGVSLLRTVACAVHYAHQHGVLHRDLKPANILLDAEDRPHVTDFGLAKRLGLKPGEVSLTQQGMIVGTPSYMAPEQAASQAAVSTAADVYSLGAILYELLTGRPPFRASTPLDTLVQLRELEPVAPRRLNRRVDRDLETVCLKCLHKQPDQRYPSAGALADDLERWLRGEPIQARPVGRCRRALKWARRRPTLAALSALLVVVSFAGVAGVIWQWREAVAESRRASHFAEAEHRTAYARTIGQSYTEWLAGNADPGRLLSEYDAELRGWEWHYLRRLFQIRQLATLSGHDDSVLAVALSPDGSRIASGSADRTVKVWDRRSQREVLTLRGHTADVTALAFSPDGNRLASGSADGNVRIWDVVRGQNVLTWRGHAAAVTGLAFDPEGKRLASTSREELSGELKLWDADKGTALASKTWHTPLTAVAFSPDGQRLVTAGNEGYVKGLESGCVGWDAATLKPVGSFKGLNERNVQWTSIAFSADGQWVAAGSSAGLVRVWDGKTAQEFPTPTQASVSGVSFSTRDGRILAAACADNTIRAWFTTNGDPAFTLRGHRGAVTAVACSSDGAYVASASRDRTVKLWDVHREDDDLTLRANKEFTSVAFSPAGPCLASSTRDRAVRIRDITTGKVVARLQRLPETVNSLSYSADGVQLACAGNDGMVRLREVPTGRETLRLKGHSGSVHAVAFHSGGGRLASAGEDGTVRLWEVPSGLETFCLRGHDGAVHAVAFSPDGGRLASAGKDGVVRVWDTGGGQERLVLNDHNGPVYAVAFSLDGRRLATAGQDEIVRVWDSHTGEPVQRLRGHLGTVRGLAYGPGGRLASAGDDLAVRLWDPAGHELLALRGHKGVVRAVAFSQDGHWLASAGDDRMIKVWDGTPLNGMSAAQK